MLSHFFNRIQDLGRNFSLASVLNTVGVRAGPKGGRQKHPIEALGKFDLERDTPATMVHSPTGWVGTVDMCSDY